MEIQLLYQLRKNPDALLALIKWAEEAVADQEESKAYIYIYIYIYIYKAVPLQNIRD